MLCARGRQAAEEAAISTNGTSWTNRGAFAETRWSVVLAAGDDPAHTIARRALGELVQIYWFPLYAFIRRQGEDSHAAEDLVQAFFACMLEKEYLADVDRSKGRFRSFLLAALKHFLSKDRDRRRAKKRGGGKTIIALDALEAEARYALEPAENMTPDRLFDRRWALALLDHVLALLRREYDRAGKVAVYQALQGCLTCDARDSYAAVGERLGMSAGAVRVAAHRLRKRYRDLLRREIAQTVDSPEQVEAEIDYLLGCL